MRRKIPGEIICLYAVLLSFSLLLLLVVEQPIIKNRWQLIIILVVYAFILIVVILNFMRKRILEPIALLMSEAKRVAEGDLSKSMHYEYHDEIGELIETFDKMREKLHQQQLVQEQFEVDRKEFIDSISHDLKAPIAASSVYVEALQDGMAKTESEVQDYLLVIQSKLAMLTELSRQLELTYQNSGKMLLELSIVSVSKWSEDFLETTRKEANAKNIIIKTTGLNNQNKANEFMIDIKQLDRALQNILDNASRFTLSLYEITLLIEKEYLKIEIRNDGANLTEGELSQIFQRFYTNNKENVSGHLGLGLSIAKTLISAMNGKIDVSLTQDIICLTVFLPLIKQKKYALHHK